MEFKEAQAIYLQIGDYLCEQILIEGKVEGDRLLSVRDLGVALQVNPNTVMRAYDFLQAKEILFNRRGVGYFVAAGAAEKIKAYRKKQFMEQDLPLLFKNIRLLEMGWEEIETEYASYLKRNEDK
jgi:DNA-binding transcriptional regulator YhcF (GntR family)